MRFVVAILIVILSFQGQISAQEKDTLVEKIKLPDKSGILPAQAGIQMSPGLTSMPMLSSDLMNGFEFQNLGLSNMNFKSPMGWRIETGTFTSMGSLNGFPFRNSPTGLYGRSVWDIYQGSYGIRTYQVNNNLSFGTAGYSERSFKEYPMKSGIYRQTNYSSSLFVGYKFSEKFSISAGFTIQRDGDPFNRNQGIQHGGIFP